MQIETLRDKLRRLADDCEERACRSHDSDARARFHTVAADARHMARAHYPDPDGLRLALEAATAQARLAAWFNGDMLSEPATSPLQALPAIDGHRHSQPVTLPASESLAPPVGALNPKQLADLFRMTARGARKAIVVAYDKGLPGFYCETHGERCRWFAEPEAFARRGGSL